MEDKLKNYFTSSAVNSEDIIQNQIEKIIKGSKFIDLLRPATIGDGIIRIDESQEKILLDLFNSAQLSGRLKKFVPASGAATRMFSKLISAIDKFRNQDIKTIKQKANSDNDAAYILTLIENLNRFAFYNDLVSIVSNSNLEFEKLRDSNPTHLLNFIVDSEGLGYSDKPKGLVKFHKYLNENRTAFIEHLIESAQYQPDFNNSISIHFTISENHLTLFEQEKFFINQYDQLKQFSFDISFSYQDKNTDSITLKENNEVYLDEFGKPLFRPAGHGALLKNLNQINGDIIFIKNIDNVCVDRLLPVTVKYKKLLAGLLILFQKKIYEYLRALENKEDDYSLRNEIIKFLSKFLNISQPDGFFNLTEHEQRNYLFNKLNRPIRVCGVVKNEGEPGGAPFWIKNSKGELSLQIIEQAQIDLSNDEQKLIFNNSTHFNPVDIVAGVRDYKGKNFNLFKFQDEDSYMIVHKKIGTTGIKSLELPGLWNGGMADWISIFVEVPKETFNPVKEIIDLLKQGHTQLS